MTFVEIQSSVFLNVVGPLEKKLRSSLVFTKQPTLKVGFLAFVFNILKDFHNCIFF